MVSGIMSKSKKRKNSGLEPISVILSKTTFLSNNAMSNKDYSFATDTRYFREIMVKVLSLKKKWVEVAGCAVAANVKVITIKPGGLLILGTTSSVWMHEVSYLKIPLLKKLGIVFPDLVIKDIRVKIIKSVEITKGENVEKPSFSPTQEESIKADEVLKNIEDQKLHQVLKKIFIKSSRKRENTSDHSNKSLINSNDLTDKPGKDID